MQTLLTLLLVFVAAGYCLARAVRFWQGRTGICGKCVGCPQSGSRAGAQALVQLGSETTLSRLPGAPRADH
jgi:hypothetical protein